MKIVFAVFLCLVCNCFVFSQSLSGKYYRSDENGKGKLSIKVIGPKSVHFEVDVVGAMFGICVGKFVGNAKFINANTAEYNDDFNETRNGKAISCKLTFIFSKNRVITRESNCNDYHGADCVFEGNYSRLPK